MLFPNDRTVLKICGVTNPAGAKMLVDEGVFAIGANFYEKSKRFIPEENRGPILAPIAGQILRVGVFVNADESEIVNLFSDGLIDVAQLHGDETPEDVQMLKDLKIPVIKALPADDLSNARTYGADAILIDTPAGKDYGGTGKTFDWSLATRFCAENPGTQIILAGGITPQNAQQAAKQVPACALDVASGAEDSPGIKSQLKVQALQKALGLRKAF